MEFALLLPVFVLLVFGMVGYALYLGAAHSIAHLAAEGARASLGGIDAAERSALSRRIVQAIAADFDPLIDPARVVVETTESGPVIRVTIRYDASRLLGWGPAFAHLFPPPLIVRSASTELVAF